MVPFLSWKGGVDLLSSKSKRGGLVPFWSLREAWACPPAGVGEEAWSQPLLERKGGVGVAPSLSWRGGMGLASSWNGKEGVGLASYEA